jgi:membrane fusion protein (multidrug efflux system)
MENKKPHIGNIIISAVAFLVVATAIFYFTQYFVRTSNFQETNDAQVEAYINPVSARVGGYVKKVWFNEHNLVKQGDTLVTIENSEYNARLQEAQAAIDDARAQLKVLNAGIHAAQVGTMVNKDQITGAKARLWQNQQDIKRYKNLMKEEAVTGAEYEQVKARFDVSESDFNAVKNTLNASNAKIQELQSRTDLLLADLKKKEAQYELARITLSYTVITAPYSGKLGRKTILEGQQIQPGQPLVYIINEKEKWVTANFMETQVNDMHVGQPVDISVDAIRGKHFKGTIEAISGSTGAKFSLLPPDNSTGNFVKIVQRLPVKIRFSSKDTDAIKVGMNVIVSVKKKS